MTSSVIDRYIECFGQGDISLFSAPGRTELSGNHTDHQHGEILAAAIDRVITAAVSKTKEPRVRVVSEGFGEVLIDLSAPGCFAPRKEEQGSPAGLVRGVMGALASEGYVTGGFNAALTSDIPAGSGLSSSAAFEVLIAEILNELYNGGTIPASGLALAGQHAENRYFGKPSGLMDQLACSMGGLIHADFSSPNEPEAEKIPFDFRSAGYCICLTDTKSSHAGMTEEYAAITREMGSVARFFGQDVLLGITEDQLTAELARLRKDCGDRAVLRALHFVRENERVKKQASALKNGDISSFLGLVRLSGESSFKYLQNVYSSSDVCNQSLSLALAISEGVLKDNGVCRVHGGGFAGTIQAFVRTEAAGEYRRAMDRAFGEGSCRVLNISPAGASRLQ